MNLSSHEKALKKNVFFTENKWPHFNLLFKDINKISKKIKVNSTVVSLERTKLYGGVSLFAPYFERNKFISVDCTSNKLKKRGSYNDKFVTNKNIVKMNSSITCNYRDIKLKSNSADWILIPNLMHHIDDGKVLLEQSHKILKSKGSLYIFEPLLRELHQVPEDYGRYTPFLLEKLLKKIGFKKFSYKFTGGPFSSIAYMWDQAIQYFPLKKRNEFEMWFKKEFKRLIKLEKKYKINLVRKNTISPVAFSIIAKK